MSAGKVGEGTKMTCQCIESVNDNPKEDDYKVIEKIGARLLAGAILAGLGTLLAFAMIS